MQNRDRKKMPVNTLRNSVDNARPLADNVVPVVK